jgi:hypothetical protein
MVPTGPYVQIVRHRNASQTLGGTQYLGATQSEHPVCVFLLIIDPVLLGVNRIVQNDSDTHVRP